jgi:UDP-glucose 4-epimerase
MVESVLKDYADAGELRSISLRYFNASGADPDGEAGELHEPETILCRWHCALLNREASL